MLFSSIYSNFSLNSVIKENGKRKRKIIIGSFVGRMLFIYFQNISTNLFWTFGVYLILMVPWNSFEYESNHGNICLRMKRAFMTVKSCMACLSFRYEDNRTEAQNPNTYRECIQLISLGLRSDTNYGSCYHCHFLMFFVIFLTRYSCYA